MENQEPKKELGPYEEYPNVYVSRKTQPSPLLRVLGNNQKGLDTEILWEDATGFEIFRKENRYYIKVY